MRAIVINEHGGPEVLTEGEVPTPEPGHGEALVRVRASGLEPGLDVRTRNDGAAWPLSMPHVLGASSAGEVAIADPEGEVEVGQRVAVIPHVTCRVCEYCRRGQDNVCVRRQFFGAHRWGGYAEYLLAPTRNLVPIAGEVGYGEAAAAALSFGTAWQLVIRRAAVAPTDTVLVLGASGAVGVGAVQISRLLGARVLAAASGPDKLRRLGEALEPDGLVDATADDLVEEVRRVNDGQGVDVVVETVGADTWQASISALRPEGRIVCCGASSGGNVSMTLRDLYRANISIKCSTVGTTQDARDVFDLVNRGVLHPLVDRTFPFEEARKAHEALVKREHVGKIVMTQES